jgi:hypothetical protein
MQQKLLYQSGVQRTYAVVLETGEEVMSCLQRFAAAEHVFAAQVTAIGAFSDLVLMYFDRDKKDYLRIPLSKWRSLRSWAIGPVGVCLNKKGPNQWIKRRWGSPALPKPRLELTGIPPSAIVHTVPQFIWGMSGGVS